MKQNHRHHRGRRRRRRPETTEEFNRRLKEDLCSPLHEYGPNWPSIKARENALLMKIHYWEKIGNVEKAAASQQELFDFWNSPREL
jgi:hypothetical protein